MTPEQSALLRKAEDSVRAARVLAAEGLHDFSVSRAYYAMFYLAEALLLGEGLSFSKHSSVIAAFGKHFAKSGRMPAELHRFLREGQDLRNVGDYGAGPGLGEDEADEQIRRAERFLEVARQFLEVA